MARCWIWRRVDASGRFRRALTADCDRLKGVPQNEELRSTVGQAGLPLGARPYDPRCGEQQEASCDLVDNCMLLPQAVPFCILPKRIENGFVFFFRRTSSDKVHLWICIGAIPFILLTLVFFRQVVLMLPVAAIANLFLGYQLIVLWNRRRAFAYIAIDNYGRVEYGTGRGDSGVANRTGTVNELAADGGKCDIVGAKSLMGRKTYPGFVWILRSARGSDCVFASESEKDFLAYQTLLPHGIDVRVRDKIDPVSGDFQLGDRHGLDQIGLR